LAKTTGEYFLQLWLSVSKEVIFNLPGYGPDMPAERELLLNHSEKPLGKASLMAKYP
jgi:hypothetical protein